MNLVDANVLLYAVNSDADHHSASRSWLDQALNGHEDVGFAWVALLAFLRLSTREDLFPRPLSRAEAFTRLREWLAQAPTVILHPTPRHAEVLEGLLAAVGGRGGNLVNDAHLAALSIEHQATIVSFDNDFDRFPGVTWRPPG